MGKGRAAPEKANPTKEGGVGKLEDFEGGEKSTTIVGDSPSKTETAVTRYQQVVADRQKLRQGAYVKTLLWGIEPDDSLHKSPPKIEHKRHNEEVFDGRRNILGDSSVNHGKLVWFARRPSADDLGKDGFDAHSYLPQKKSISFSMLLFGTVLHYAVLFFYFGALGMYEGFYRGGRNTYISVAPPEGTPEWAPSTKSYIAKKEKARDYVADYFEEAWKVMMGMVFGFQLAMAVFHIAFSHHRKGTHTHWTHTYMRGTSRDIYTHSQYTHTKDTQSAH
jgi:hypothetical protein